MTTPKANFLIAMPSLGESIFSHSVILLAERGESGSLGFIINLPIETQLTEAFSKLKTQPKQKIDLPILFGGPVQTDFFWLIHSPDYEGKTTIKLHPDFFLTAALDLLPILDRDSCPTIFSGGVGYAGWAPGQLEKEIEEGAWWYNQFDSELLFKIPFDQRWPHAIKVLGADPESLVDLTNPLNPSIN